MQKSDFLTKLNKLVRECVPYVYPDTKEDYLPQFDKPVMVETSFLKNFKALSKARKKMKHLDLKGLEWTYDNLNDEFSKEMMLRVVVYNLFKKVKIRFPLYYSDSFPKLNDLEEQMKTDDEQINLWYDIIKLKKYDLKAINYNIKIWLNIGGLFIDFIKEQYKYQDIVKVEKDDFVIGGGACYGDTALYFADKGAKKIFSFEFLDENIDIFQKNMELNPQYKDKIELVKKPLSDKSNEKLYAIGNGPGTSVTSEYKEGAVEFNTVAIDDFVEQNGIEKINFLKLDVECSEAPTLKGAIKTIRKFKPKLAICVYHKQDDLWVIPQLIKEILPEYKLYLDHHTINFTETVVYAKV